MTSVSSASSFLASGYSWSAGVAAACAFLNSCSAVRACARRSPNFAASAASAAYSASASALTCFLPLITRASLADGRPRGLPGEVMPPQPGPARQDENAAGARAHDIAEPLAEGWYPRDAPPGDHLEGDQGTDHARESGRALPAGSAETPLPARVQRRVAAAAGQEVPGRPVFGDPAARDDQYPVGDLHRGQPVGDDERGAPCEDRAQRLLHQPFARDVEQRG